MDLSPADLNFPDKFSDFRPAQREVFSYGLTSEKRFTGMGLPPGSGKSGVGYGFTQLIGGKSVILTADRGLEDQYVGDGFPGMIDMRGRSNFRCWESGNCEDGARMDCKSKGDCPYGLRLAQFNQSTVGLSNYAWWIAVNNMARQGCAMPDTLICDEAHLIFDWLSRSLDFYITDREIRDAGIIFETIPSTADEWHELQPLILDIARDHASSCRDRARSSKSDRDRAAVRKAEALVEKIQRISMVDPDNWVLWRETGRDEGRAFRFDCVWPYRYKERVFLNIPRVILMSATLRPKTLALLGISKSEYDFKEWGRQFPAVNGPVVHYKGQNKNVRVTHTMSGESKTDWLTRVMDIVRWGSDRKGIIHSVSYARAKEIAAFLASNGINPRLIQLNGAADPDSQSSREAYDKFVKMGPGAILISPSFSTGWDFAGKRAEWQIISKIAFVDTRSPVMARRKADDKTYPNYLAAQDLVQSCGRVQRSETDRGISFIIDDNCEWFLPMAKEFVPHWFRIRKETELPKPLALL